MCACARLLLLAALPALVGRVPWCAGGEVVSVSAGPEAPAFAPRARTSIIAAVGQAATLDCKVLRLGDKSVSWVRSRDLQILTHAGMVFTADGRVSAAEARAGGGASKHSLRIERLRTQDAGRYECQVNTEPKMSLFFNLTVVDEPVPKVLVSVVGDRELRARHGGAATLACEARYDPPPQALPMAPLDIRWTRAESTSPLSLQSSRGGISLDTERWAARAVSRVTLAELRASDTGTYVCTAAGAADTIRLDVVDQEEHMEMQRDQSASGVGGGVLPARGVMVLLTLVVLATSRGIL